MTEPLLYVMMVRDPKTNKAAIVQKLADLEDGVLISCFSSDPVSMNTKLIADDSYLEPLRPEMLANSEFDFGRTYIQVADMDTHEVGMYFSESLLVFPSDTPTYPARTCENPEDLNLCVVETHKGFFKAVGDHIANDPMRKLAESFGYK